MQATFMFPGVGRMIGNTYQFPPVGEWRLFLMTKQMVRHPLRDPTMKSTRSNNADARLFVFFSRRGLERHCLIFRLIDGVST